MAAHFGQDGAERDRGTDCAQGVFGTDHQSRRRLAPDALQRGDHFNDDRAPLLERFLQRTFLFIEPVEPVLGGADIGFDLAHPCRGIDQLDIELAAILSEHFDFAAQLGLGFGGIALPRQCRVQFLVAPFDGIGGVGGLVGRGFRGSLRRRAGT